MQRVKLLIFLALAVTAGVAYFAFDLGQYLSLDYLKAREQVFLAYRADHPLQSAAAFFAFYVLVAATSLPGGAVLTLAGGALFGLVGGTVLISFASTIGATLAFLASRYLLHDWVRSRFRKRFEAVDRGFEREGALYLLSLRLIPAIPFFAVNLLMGLTKMPVLRYYWVSQLGMLPGTAAFVNAGTRLARIDSLRDVLSPTVIGSFVLLAVLPLAAGKLVQLVKARRIYAKWPKPARFDRNLVVIGAGAAGLVTAYVAAAARAKVTLIEGGKMGGDCLNYGCVPSKALIRSAKFVGDAKRSAALGIAKADLEVDFADVMARVQRVIREIEPHDSAARYAQLGVDVVHGHARIVTPWEVEVNGRRLSTRAIVIAAGAKPAVPPIPGLEDVGYLTSDTLWSLREQPKHMVVLGGGPIGCELAQAFARFGTRVTLVEMAPRLLAREDPEVSTLVTQAMRADGVELLTACRAVRCERDGDTRRLFIRPVSDAPGEDAERAIEFDLLLCAVGRTARTEGYGLEQLGIPLTKGKTIDTDGYLQTLYPNIFACGDAAGPYQFTHVAAHQAWYAAVNALFGQFKRFRVSYDAIPACTFTVPEVARAGLSEQQAREQNIAFEVTRYDLDDLDRAIADEAARGFVKVLTPPGKDKILGVTIAGEHAGELLAEYTLAMKHGLGLKKILGTVHAYPTMSEANKYAAGAWRRAHLSPALLRWAQRYHDWRRGTARRAEQP